MQFVEANIMLIGTAIISGLMLLWSFFGNRIRGIKEASCVEALQLINRKNAVVLDVREESEFKTGHILNAKNIPLDTLKERIGELERYRKQPIIVMCRSGARSSIACGRLGKQGFPDIYLLSGGMMAWQKGNMPLKK